MNQRATSKTLRKLTLKFTLFCVLSVSSASADAFKSSEEPIQPLPLKVALDPEKVQLGKRLFEDRRLSHDNSISCASCHHLKTGGADTRARSIGIGGAKGDVNAPTVLNSGFNFYQFWDGRAKDLDDQINGPVQSSVEMGSTWAEVVQKLTEAKDYNYSKSFSGLYSDGIQPKNIRDTIAIYERSLTTPDSSFDQYLRGRADAISDRAKQGYQKFKAFGCVSCHQGVNVGGNMFQKFGVMRDYFAERKRPLTRADLGRFNVTHNENDKYFFKVPSLRNVALTAPYFHDASAATLNEAVGVMAKYQLGRTLTQRDEDLIVEFLKTLTGTAKELP